MARPTRHGGATARPPARIRRLVDVITRYRIRVRRVGWLSCRRSWTCVAPSHRPRIAALLPIAVAAHQARPSPASPSACPTQ